MWIPCTTLAILGTVKHSRPENFQSPWDVSDKSRTLILTAPSQMYIFFDRYQLIVETIAKRTSTTQLQPERHKVFRDAAEWATIKNLHAAMLVVQMTRRTHQLQQAVTRSETMKVGENSPSSTRTPVSSHGFERSVEEEAKPLRRIATPKTVCKGGQTNTLIMAQLRASF